MGGNGGDKEVERRNALLGGKEREEVWVARQAIEGTVKRDVCTCIGREKRREKEDAWF